MPDKKVQPAKAIPPAKVVSSFTIEPHTLDQIDRLAAAEGISRSELIRWLLNEYVRINK